VSKDENSRLTYPYCVRKEGLAPSQYGTKGLVGDKLVEMEEKYDLNKEGMSEDGFGEEGEEDTSDADADDDGGEDNAQEIF
jgi:hypothetical protein